MAREDGGERMLLSSALSESRLGELLREALDTFGEIGQLRSSFVRDIVSVGSVRISDDKKGKRLSCEVVYRPTGSEKERKCSVNLFVKQTRKSNVDSSTYSSAENEIAFYRYVAPRIKKYIRIPTPVYLSTEKSSCLIVMDTVDADQYEQRMPLVASEARASLTLLARLHAWGWNDRDGRLKEARRYLTLKRGTFWDLKKANHQDELNVLPKTWRNFSNAFSRTSKDAQSLLSQSRMTELGERMVSLCPWIANEIHSRLVRRWKTLVHGDFKAKNVFIPPHDDRESSWRKSLSSPTARTALGVLIDFGYTGVGIGMMDVCMHLHHSVALEALANGGEEKLLRFYYDELIRNLPDRAARDYPWIVAQWHYKLSLVDYGRVVLSRFWNGASPEIFAARMSRPSVTGLARSVKCALRFIRRLESCVTDAERARASRRAKRIATRALAFALVSGSALAAVLARKKNGERVKRFSAL